MTIGSSSEGPELFFGLIGAVGTDLKEIASILNTELFAVGYQSQVIRLTTLLLELPSFSAEKTILSGPEDVRIDTLMTAGDRFRKMVGRADAMALLGIADIQELRQRVGKEPTVTLKDRRGYIFHSLKHPDEVKTLRALYGSAFIAISAYAPRSLRLQNLSTRIAHSHDDYGTDGYRQTAEVLIDRDERERGDDFGQNIEGTFPLADFFIDASEENKVSAQVARLIRILFRHPFSTPTVDEYGMFHAKAAALRSADLSRQVGAVVTTVDGEIISAGCNEVPKAGGGSVWEGSVEPAKDYRDFQIGHDPTSERKRGIVQEIFSLIQKDWLKGELQSQSPATLAADALKGVLRGSRADSLLEFGRIVHAEMAALMDAARRGIAVKGHTVFCTTFPCHMCARHIMNAGISRVVYIEPYPKSLTKELYKKSVQVDFDDDKDEDALKFEPFVGVSPRRYIDFFEMDGWITRKDRNGHAIKWEKNTSRPRVNEVQTYGIAELAYLKHLKPVAASQEGPK